MSLKRSYEPAQKTSEHDEALSNLFESGQILDRASKFIGLFSPATDTPPKVLQQHPPFQKATHRILAWRLPSRQQTVQFEKSKNQQSNPSKKPLVYDTGSLDDGEKYAGKKLEKLLIELDVVGTVVVARWYGGVMLGPVRFDHIVNAAKEAILEYQESIAITADHDTSLPSKKPKTQSTENEVLTPEQEAEQKVRLVKALTDRDNNIVVLRQLLAQKKTKKKAETTSTTQSESPLKSSSSQTPKPLPDYAAMSLTKLKQLDKARDTTISWILKQIDEAEGLQTPTSSIAETSEH
ncbi:hypothetical protein LTR05_007558 [Lithohypha guttulata]|uniref:Impact N-terminal domain-containing protein n=1 Tax=Lithohypha guttulata TaxID=1690604 RepID=A0AAN7SVB2_9EURO|nr:hypothetical protein LTR05_007558 [Lithohypha guttulata]